jgi:hypothetical protein
VVIAAAVASVVACGLSVAGSATESPSEDGGTSSSSSSSSSGGEADGSMGRIEDSGAVPTDAPPNTSCALGNDGGTGLSCNGLCVDPNRDRSNCGGCGIVCDVVAACEGSCVNVATGLKGMRVQLPCGPGGTFQFCGCSQTPVTKEITIEGTAGKTYLLNVRMRGVAEQKGFTGGPASGGAVGMNSAFFITGGNPRNDNWTLLQLDIASPQKRYNMNAGESGNDFSDPFDYVAPITVASGTKLTLTIGAIDDKQSPAENSQGQQVSAPGLPFYDGEFVQLDVQGATALP